MSAKIKPNAGQELGISAIIAAIVSIFFSTLIILNIISSLIVWTVSIFIACIALILSVIGFIKASKSQNKKMMILLAISLSALSLIMCIYANHKSNFCEIEEVTEEIFIEKEIKIEEEIDENTENSKEKWDEMENKIEVLEEEKK